MAIALQTTMPPAGWLRSRSFDLGFIAGIAALALGSGAIVVWIASTDQSSSSATIARVTETSPRIAWTGI